MNDPKGAGAKLAQASLPGLSEDVQALITDVENAGATIVADVKTLITDTGTAATDAFNAIWAAIQSKFTLTKK